MIGISPPGSCHRWRSAVARSAAGNEVIEGMQIDCRHMCQKATGSLQGTERSEFMLDGLSAALQARSDCSSEKDVRNTPSLVDCFRARRPFKLDLASYLLRIRQYIPCSDACFVLSLVYIDRIAQKESLLIVDGMTCHRLVLTSIMLATRFHDDEEELRYDNAFFAKVGGFRAAELATMERAFLQLMRWRLFVSVAEYNQYLKVMSTASLHDKVPMAN
mmetsp:Transcript_120911/g.240874  ORF Transcript_120911/g.240874 Transcript_120911/m.240874 type:complete len:218 (+) Transcript_120911:44-697(+)